MKEEASQKKEASTDEEITRMQEQNQAWLAAHKYGVKAPEWIYTSLESPVAGTMYLSNTSMPSFTYRSADLSIAEE